MCDSYLTTTESFNAMTKEVRVAAPSFSRLLIDITSIWASHLASSWMEAGSTTNALTRSKQPTLDALKDTATTLGAQKQAPGCVIVHSDLDPGGLMSVISSDSGFRATGATCQCTYLAVVGLPCAHVIAGANAISVLRPGSRRTPKSDNAQSRWPPAARVGGGIPACTRSPT